MTPSAFLQKFPEFATVDPVRIQEVIDDADPFFNVEAWGSWYAEGLGYYIAHIIVIKNVDALQRIDQANANDVLTRAISGAVSMARDATMMQAQARDPFQRTTYGQRYAYLRDLVGMGGVVV